MKIIQSNVVQWKDEFNRVVVWLVTQDITKGVVVHSENSSYPIGLYMDLTDIKIEQFIGTINICSKVSNG